MSKAILLSIKPKWVAKILNGEKTIEIRKKFPKDYRGWVYIYCTKSTNKKCEYDYHGKRAGGKVIARFWCNEVLPIIKVIERCGLYYYTCQTEQFYYNPDKLTSRSCLNTNQIRDYLGDKNGYAIHIGVLVIFGKPKELSEFGKYEFDFIGYAEEKSKVDRCFNKDCYLFNKHIRFIPLTKAPQSYCFVEVEE